MQKFLYAIDESDQKFCLILLIFYVGESNIRPCRKKLIKTCEYLFNKSYLKHQIPFEFIGF
tara:strand:+ start:472 stop:654 length:183 start_codon:yes stop_codon:yes gene_type:complete